MNRSDLIERLAEINPELPLDTLDVAVKAMLDQMTETLVAGGRIEIRGFDSFSARTYEGRELRNSNAGKLYIPVRQIVAGFQSPSYRT